MTVFTIKRGITGWGGKDWREYEDVALAPVDPIDSAKLKKIRTQSYYGSIIGFAGYVLLLFVLSHC